MSDTGAFRALARYLDREVLDRCTAHPRCLLRSGHAGPPRTGLNPGAPAWRVDLGPGEGR